MKKKAFLLALIPILGIGIYSLFHKQEVVLPRPPPHEKGTWETLAKTSQLKMILKGFAINTMVDLPSTATPDLPLKEYIAFDQPMERGPIPRADLISCWDTLSCLSPNLVRSALVQLQKSGSRFVLMTHYPDLKENVSDPNGGFSPTNWCIAPYFFDEPIIQISDESNGEGRFLALWSVDTLRTH